MKDFFMFFIIVFLIYCIGDILSGINSTLKEILKELYGPFVSNHDRFIFMDVKSAEMTKYAANCMLATKISFINEIANICEKVGADVRDVRLGIGADQRIGYHFIYPGLGYGGSCFPKDVKALIRTAQGAGVKPELLEAVENVNARQKKVMAHKILDYFASQGGVQGKTLALWGLAFTQKLLMPLLPMGRHRNMPMSLAKVLHLTIQGEQ